MEKSDLMLQTKTPKQITHKYIAYSYKKKKKPFNAGKPKANHSTTATQNTKVDHPQIHSLFIEAFHQTQHLHYKPTNENTNRK